MERRSLLLTLCAVFTFAHGIPGLKVNVRANGDDEDDENSGSYRQDIIGNSSTETVLIQYSTGDGTLVSQLTDFRSSSQIIRIMIPGEEELLQPTFQALCFVSNYGGDLIPPEAVNKLRQKHPGTIRIAEQDNGEIVQDSPLTLMNNNPSKLSLISSHLPNFCSESQILSSHHELFTILEKNQRAKVSSISRPSHMNYDALPRCFSAKESRQACICSFRICINWFPCALKYCSNKEGEGEHRCGIKTCRKCLTFRYSVSSKEVCHWDEI